MLSVDNLVSADVVLADRSFVTARATDNPDLFWALRGGGGNFGVVTSLELRCHPVRNVVTGPVLYDVEDAGDVLRWYRRFLPSAPDDLNGFFAFMTVPPAPPFPEHLHMRNVCGIMWCYVGPPEQADDVLAPVRAFGTPLLDGIHEAPFPALQAAFDGLYPPGLQWYWRADFFDEITEDAIAVHERFGKVPTMHSTMHPYPIDGAPHDADAGDTAFSYRDATWAGVIAGVDPDPANLPLIREWAVDYWGDMLEGWIRGGHEGAALIAEGIRRLRERGAVSRLPYYLALVAETLMDADRAEEAATVLAEAHQLARHHADWWWLPELWRLGARLDPGADGDLMLERALDVAGDQGSASLALRAGTDLAERLVARGDADRGRRVLRPLRAACVGSSPELDAIDTRVERLLAAESPLET